MIKRQLLRSKYVKKLNSRRNALAHYKNAIKPGKHSKKILFWSTGGMVIQSNLEGAVAAALKMRGHKVLMVLCDGVYKACAKRVDFPDESISEWAKYCPSCIRHNSQLFDNLALDYIYISDLVPPGKAEELRKLSDSVDPKNYQNLTYNGLNVGNHLESAMMRHMRGSSYEGKEELLKEYAFAVLVNAAASYDAIKRFGPDRVYMSHGIYADWGPALSEALNANIPVTSYTCCYLNAHFYFGTVRKKDETFLSVTPEAWEMLKDEKLNGKSMWRTEHFLDQRYKKNIARDMEGILKNYKGDRQHFIEHYGLKNDKPVWGVMTHINWDAVSDYFPMIHDNFDHWLFETVKVISEIPEVQWLIKIHPSEINDNPTTGCQAFLEKNFPDLPGNIKVLKMDDDISPLDFYSLLDGCVTVMGTGGLELALQGKPVILAGQAHYSRKGFTYDPDSHEEYENLLRKAGGLGKLSDEQMELAWKYGYTYFIRKQIPLTPVIQNDLRLDMKRISNLLPGNNSYIDFLCDRIIDGKDFIMSEELVEQNHAEDKEQNR